VKLQKNSQELADRIVEIVGDIGPPMTVRQVYYQCVVRELVANKPTEYRKVQRLVLELRRSQELRYGDIVDRSRRVERPSSWADLDDFMSTVRVAYRKDLWGTQQERVEIWCEKDAMAGFVSDVTAEYGIPLYVIRGYCSETMLFNGAEGIKAAGKPTTIYYLGDHDPSGRDIERQVQEALVDFGAEFSFSRLAILKEDIDRFDLPPQKAKKGDKRSKRFVERWGQETAELDALPPDELRRRLRKAIEAHINRKQWKALLRIEHRERETLQKVAL
jgi:hypothetical protein